MKLSHVLARRNVRRSVISGGLVALLMLIGGAALSLSQHKKWTAQSEVVILPSAHLDSADSAAFYETLSRGQVVATFAEVASNIRFAQQAEAELHLTATQRAATSVVVSVVPNTSVILIRATSDSAGLAERISDASTAQAQTYFGSLSKPYRSAVVRSAKGSAYAAGTSTILLLIATLIVALVVGVAVQQAVYHLFAIAEPDPVPPSEEEADAAVRVPAPAVAVPVPAGAAVAPSPGPKAVPVVPVVRPSESARPARPSDRDRGIFVPPKPPELSSERTSTQTLRAPLRHLGRRKVAGRR